MVNTAVQIGSDLDYSTESGAESDQQILDSENADLEKLLAMAVEEDLPAQSNKPESSTPLGLPFGSALKKAADGSVIGPKIVVRAPKVKVSIPADHFSKPLR